LALSFGRSNEEDVVSLIAAKKYARAIEILKARLQKKGPNPSLRMQLADVLILADKRQEAVSLLLPLADQFARDGFAAKAVSVLKKIQKVDPGRREVEERLARLIEERQREAVRPREATSALGMEEAGAAFPDAPEPEAGALLDIGFVMAPVSAPVEPTVRFEAPPVAERAPLPPRAAPPPSSPGATQATSPDATLPVSSPLVAPLLSAEPLPALVEIPTPPQAPPAPAAPVAESAIEDYDLLYAGSAEDAEEIDVPLEMIEEPSPAEPMSAGQFADELIGLVDSVFQEFAAPADSALVAPAVAPPSQIVVSPLFRDFSVDEMVAVIHGLRLLTFDRGGVILREGSPGGSLYTLTSGRVRAFKKDPATGRQDQLGDLAEGAFFGEMSILTGQPRMASIVALTRCELLELDRPTLDQITKTHPHVWDVLREFAQRREADARRLSG
jgi:cyclic nucleotide-binding protein/tetratricopeptide repeat protein